MTTTRGEVLTVLVLMLVFTVVGFLQYKYKLGWRNQLYTHEHGR